MALNRHDDLDELDEDPVPEIVVEETKPRKPLNLKPLVTGLVVLVLGGALGGAVYVFTTSDTRDLIGLLDIGEAPPKLSMALPGLGDGDNKAPSPGGGLLTPPGIGGATPGEILKALPDDAPPPAAALPPEGKPPSGQPPVEPPVAVTAAPPVAAPAQPDAGAAELARLEAASVKAPVKAKVPDAKSGKADPAAIPTQPNPRTADKQPPSFDQLAPVKGEVKPLIAAPLKELLRKTQVGDLPYPAADGRQPWQVYARPWSGPADKGKVAVVVVGLGMDHAAAEAAIAKLPPEVVLSFSPYAPSLDKWIKKARDFGHEVLLDLPAEAPGFPIYDPGPYGLMAALSPEKNLDRLETVMSKAAGYAGLISLGDVYGASPQIAGTLAALREHGLIYLGAGKGEAGKVPPLMRVEAIADSDPFKEAIDMRLNQVSIKARTAGQAVAVVRGRPLSLLRLMVWINDLGGQNLVLAPATTVVQQAVASGKS